MSDLRERRGNSENSVVVTKSKKTASTEPTTMNRKTTSCEKKGTVMRSLEGEHDWTTAPSGAPTWLVPDEASLVELGNMTTRLTGVKSMHLDDLVIPVIPPAWDALKGHIETNTPYIAHGQYGFTLPENLGTVVLDNWGTSIQAISNVKRKQETSDDEKGRQIGQILGQVSLLRSVLGACKPIVRGAKDDVKVRQALFAGLTLLVNAGTSIELALATPFNVSDKTGFWIANIVLSTTTQLLELVGLKFSMNEGLLLNAVIPSLLDVAGQGVLAYTGGSSADMTTLKNKVLFWMACAVCLVALLLRGYLLHNIIRASRETRALLRGLFNRIETSLSTTGALVVPAIPYVAPTLPALAGGQEMALLIHEADEGGSSSTNPE